MGKEAKHRTGVEVGGPMMDVDTRATHTHAASQTLKVVDGVQRTGTVFVSQARLGLAEAGE